MLMPSERIGIPVKQCVCYGALYAAVISKNFKNGGSKYSHAHNSGVAQLQLRPYFQWWKYDNLV